MKTAISIPDALFEKAEQAAKELSLSRSELYARAIETFLRSLAQQDVTERLNQVYAAESSSLDPALERMQAASLTPESW
jgi:metal-responsive CopG/Arc/MetJ family transcriptional regulator